MKKLLAFVLAAVMALSMMSFASAETAAFDGDVKVWVADAVSAMTVEKIEEFKAAHPEYANMTVTIEAVGEGDAANKMVTDVEGGADIFVFAQDQLARLVAAGALEVLSDENAEIVKAENDAGAVAAVIMGDMMYAYPMTSDNGYFMYYDKSVITDPTNLDAILADCEKAGKKFYMEINSGWYQTAFFFGAGCTLTYDANDDGEMINCNIDYASDKGVDALKTMIKLASSSAFVNGSSASTANDYAVLIDGVWDSDTVQKALGENYAAAKLPTFTVADRTYQMGGFGGFKMLGIKPQTDEAKLAACDALALYLSGEEMQTARFELAGWGPSNLKAQASEAVQNNVALAALASQLANCIPQGQYPSDYWTQATALGDDVIAGKYADADDAALMEVLNAFQESCLSYVTAAEAE